MFRESDQSAPCIESVLTRSRNLLLAENFAGHDSFALDMQHDFLMFFFSRS